MKKRTEFIIIGFIFLFVLTISIVVYYYCGSSNSNYVLKAVDSEIGNDIDFNEYLKRDNGRIIYLASNLKEFYFYERGEKKQTLKEYANTWQTLNNIIKNITDNLDLYGELNDGGTKIYKGKKKDTTIVVCNTTLGNKDIFIGNYEMQFDSKTMCIRDVSNLVTLEDLNLIDDKIIEYFQSDDREYDNLSHVYVDEKNMVVVVGLLDNSKKQQEKFRELVIDSEYIVFEKGDGITLN